MVDWVDGWISGGCCEGSCNRNRGGDGDGFEMGLSRVRERTVLLQQG